MKTPQTQRLLGRQRQLLALLAALGGRVGNLDFQKLLFLFCQESTQSPAYEFVPYRYGAFSFTSYADRRTLVQHGLLEHDTQNWAITAKGRQVVNGWVVAGTRFFNFAKQYRRLHGDELVAETYRRYPYYAIRSEITHVFTAGLGALCQPTHELRRG
jgi:hypothetical protein